MAYNQNPYFNGYYPQGYSYPNNGAMPDMLNQQKMAYQQPVQMPQMQPTQMSVANDFIWVLSEVEAQSYPVAPNNTVTLWDKNTPTIYIKSANAQGVPTLRILDFTERGSEPFKTSASHECQCGGKYVPIERFEALEREFDTFKKEYKKPIKKNAEKEIEE